MSWLGPGPTSVLNLESSVSRVKPSPGSRHRPLCLRRKNKHMTYGPWVGEARCVHVPALLVVSVPEPHLRAAAVSFVR